MTKINQPSSTPRNTTQQINNFTELNFKEVNIGGSKIAWTFFKVNIDESYGQIGSREYPSYFYIKTESGSIYKIFKKDYNYIKELCEIGACEHIINTGLTDWCIYDPRTKTVIGIENTEIRLGEVFAYATKCTTLSSITEIVGVSSSQGGESTSLKSNIEENFIKKLK